jgi:polyhydroxyalkanoate synthesis regulator protein
MIEQLEVDTDGTNKMREDMSKMMIEKMMKWSGLTVKRLMNSWTRIKTELMKSMMRKALKIKMSAVMARCQNFLVKLMILTMILMVHVIQKVSVPCQ